MDPWLLSLTCAAVVLLWFVVSWTVVQASWFASSPAPIRFVIWSLLGLPFAIARPLNSWLQGCSSRISDITFFVVALVTHAVVGVALVQLDCMSWLLGFGWWALLGALPVGLWVVVGVRVLKSRWFGYGDGLGPLLAYTCFFVQIAVAAASYWVWRFMCWVATSAVSGACSIGARLPNRQPQGPTERERRLQRKLDRSEEELFSALQETRALERERDQLRDSVRRLDAELSRQKRNSSRFEPGDVREFLEHSKERLREMSDALVVATQAFIKLYEDAAKPVAAVEELHERLSSLAEGLGVQSNSGEVSLEAYVPEDPRECFGTDDKREARKRYRKLALFHPDRATRFGGMPWLQDLANEFLKVLNNRYGPLK